MKMNCLNCAFWNTGKFPPTDRLGVTWAICDAHSGQRTTDETTGDNVCASWIAKDYPPIQVLLSEILKEMNRLNVSIARMLISDDYISDRITPRLRDERIKKETEAEKPPKRGRPPEEKG